MTMNPPPSGPPEYIQPAPMPGYAAMPQPSAPMGPPQKNILGIVALIVSAIGFVFACVPGALIVGWVLLPVGFILGLVSLFLKGKIKWQGITAIVVSIVGTIVGVIVFVSLVATAFSDAVGSSDVEIGTAAPVGENESAAPEADSADESDATDASVGTRENPLALGTPFSSDEWTVTINSVTLDATEQVLAANSFNDARDAGTEYIIVNYTVMYTGDDADGSSPAFISMEYVTAGGNTVDSLDKIVIGPDEMDAFSTLYTGASATGNETMQVPSPVDGVLAVRPGMFVDKVFVAVQ